MDITIIRYAELFNLGDYNNRRLEVEGTLAPGETPAAAFETARRLVQAEARRIKRATAIDDAQFIVNCPEEYGEFEVGRAREKLQALGVLPPDPPAEPAPPPTPGAAEIPF